MMVVILFLNNLKIAVSVLIILQIVVGIVIYLILSILTKNKSFVYLLSFIKERFKNA
jgi:hypothetical protein